MVNEVELSSFDLRYAEHRLRNPKVERLLCTSILEQGILTPLEGVDHGDDRILLNGFKRYRCAQKIGIKTVPYISMGTNEVLGIIEFIRISNIKSLSILEQASLIADLKKVHKMSVGEIAADLSRSKSWVSVRTGLMDEMSKAVRTKLFRGEFPVYSYMYTLRRFIRINGIKQEEITRFVTAVSGKKLSIRDIKRLAYGYFLGPKEFQEQVLTGNIKWGLNHFKEIENTLDDCNEQEKELLRDMEISKTTMQRIIGRCQEPNLKSRTFYAQGNLLSGSILIQLQSFKNVLRRFYDQSGKA